MTSRQLNLFRFASALLLGMFLATTLIHPWSWFVPDVVAVIGTAWLWLFARPEPEWRLPIQRSCAAGRSSRGLQETQ